MGIGYHLISTSKLIPAEWNYKTEDEFMSGQLNNNLKEKGVIQNLLVRQLGKKYEVVDGNHRLTEIIKLGIKEVMVWNFGEISEEEAYEASILINETNVYHYYH